MTVKLDYDEAVALLDRAVEEKGADYVYPGVAQGECLYFEWGDQRQPGCIVGHVLHYKGIPSLLVKEVALADSGLGEVAGIEADRRTNKLLSVVQTFQDAGEPWGKAVKKAKEKTT